MNKLTALAAVAVLALAGCSASPPAKVAAPLPAVTVTIAGPTVTVTAPAPKPTKAVVVAPVPVTIEQGQWEVGVDVPAGVYKVVTAISADAGCYWSITEHGNPGNIISNDLPSGGRPTVTLKKGQDFATNDCGSWAKVR